MSVEEQQTQAVGDHADAWRWVNCCCCSALQRIMAPIACRYACVGESHSQKHLETLIRQRSPSGYNQIFTVVSSS
ncbi:hypothetical protein [Limobrevibacterium gyesilva]|uniref:hypothetical protein n=1 Tax=Limobrevibacterium gyesilva TaxID=2991712 RepID=UPI0022276DC3|nr:hypothetical protein [Limobrevibacterium gyesilva]